MIRQSFKSIFSLFVLLLSGVLSMSAQQVTEKAALSKAQEFFTRSDVVSRRAARKAPQLTLATNRDEFYVFNDEANGGYVVVSGEERMPDILMFSEDGSYNEKEMPCNMKAWLDDYARQVSYLRTHPEAKSSRRARANKANIGNLLDCWFDQGNPYNDKCPEVDGKHCSTGCVATAMAQIMYYYKWPNQTLETIPAYTTFTLNISVPEIPVTTIDWANILEGYNDGDTYNATQADAVATLMKLCGSSAEMDYTIIGSGAQTYAARNAFIKFFGYSDMIESVSRFEFNTDDWEQLVYDELNAKRPVLYIGISETRGGHAFVLDGYKDGFFHVNWGWGGSESYVMMTGEDDWQGFTIFHSAVISIQPDNGEYTSQYAVVEGEKMTVYYDNKRSQRSGTVLAHKEDWQNYKDIITEIVIDPSFAKLNLRSLASFFDNMEKLQKIEGIENLNTNNVTDMSNMFRGCNSLTSLNVIGFKTDNVKDMDYMFQNCSSLTSLDVSGFITDNVKYMTGMFSGCSNLTTIYASERWDMSKVEATDDMFYNCEKLVGGAGTVYTPDFINGEYARIDKGPSAPGYFTYKAPPYIPGDVNGDGLVNVTDIVATVNYIMEKSSPDFNKEAADLNGDGEINVTDIVMMVSIIMNGDGGSSRRTAATSSNLIISGNNIQLRNAETYTAAQFDINLSDGQSISNVVLNGSSDHDLYWKMIDTNTCRVVVYSMTNAAFCVNDDNLFNVFMNGGQDATISNDLLIKAEGATGIDAIRRETENGKVYDLNGRQVKNPRKGVYIINGRKVVVK